jgi:hypothetical protein
MTLKCLRKFNRATTKNRKLFKINKNSRNHLNRQLMRHFKNNYKMIVNNKFNNNNSQKNSNIILIKLMI